MGRRLSLVEQQRSEQEEAIIFDLIYWWQQKNPTASLFELADWWDQNRGIRTDEEFSRLLNQILKQPNSNSFSEPSFTEGFISHERQQRIEQGVLRCLSYL